MTSLTRNDKYPPKGFPTAGEAIAYGLEAAKWIVDSGPASTPGGPLRKKEEKEALKKFMVASS